MGCLFIETYYGTVTDMGRACSTYGERTGSNRVSVRKPEGRTPLGISRRRWGIILKWTFKKWNEGYGLHHSDSEQEQVAGSYECGSEPSGSTIKCDNFLSSWGPLSFSGKILLHGVCQLHYGTNSFCKNVLKIAKPQSRLRIEFL